MGASIMRAAFERAHHPSMGGRHELFEHPRDRVALARFDASQSAVQKSAEDDFNYRAAWRNPPMNTADVSAVAHHLFESHGAKAIAEAAQKAASFEKAGDEGQARFWRRVQAVLQEMRGPKES
jgi:hypothetical protein